MPVEEALALVITEAGSLPIHRHIAKDWFLGAVKSRKIRAFPKETTLYELPEPVDFSEIYEAGFRMRPNIEPVEIFTGPTAELYMLGIDDCLADELLFVKFRDEVAKDSRVGRGEVQILAQPGEALAVYRKFEADGRAFLAVSEGIRVYREAVHWFLGRPDGQKLEPAPPIPGRRIKRGRKDGQNLAAIDEANVREFLLATGWKPDTDPNASRIADGLVESALGSGSRASKHTRIRKAVGRVVSAERSECN